MVASPHILGGRIWKEDAVPIITVNGPPVEDLERKREFVKDVTDAAARFYEFPKEKIAVLIKENRPENVGVGGRLIADRVKPAE